MITTILWRAIVAAILPMSLRDIISKLPQIAERLARLTGYTKRQLDNYRQRHRIRPHELAIEIC